ncbi:hypothetical protein IW148_005281 [Coemansia sp. RSA 1199]|nr:hypothetical protein IW148_005281 [Coemansia sp. RSA 1199]
MPFSSTAPDINVEIIGQTGDAERKATRVDGRVVVRCVRATAVHGVRVEFVGEETVSLRAWVPLSTTTQTRDVVRQARTVRSGGVLAAGTHEFGFCVHVPWWVPSTLDRDMCRIRYVVRAVVERASLAAYLGAAGAGSAWTAEREVECHHVRSARRLARRKRVDQSVGCPDGSCHVRVWGSVSRDVVKPGAQLRLDLSARTSDARFGLRLLGVHFAECVVCHVQVKGEERMVNRITHLATCRLDALDDEDEDGASEETARATLHVPPQGQLARGIRKTRSRLAILLRNASSASPPPVPSSGAGLSPSFGSPPPAPPAIPPITQPRVVRQVRASQVVQVPLGLSQFSSELVSREYRLVVVAAVAPLEPLTAAESVHTNDSTRLAYQPQHARSAHNLGTSRSSSSSASAASSLLTGARYSEGARYSGAGRRRQSESGITPPPLPQQQQQKQQQQQQSRWAISEQSSAMAAWSVDVVDHFDVQFDELVSPEYSNADSTATTALTEPEIVAGTYSFESLSPSPSPSSTLSLEQPPSQERVGHHRRTSSGLVGFLMRGFRSNASSPSAMPASPSALPTSSQPNSPSALPTSPQPQSSSTRTYHARSVSGGSSVSHTHANREPRQPRALSSPPHNQNQGQSQRYQNQGHQSQRYQNQGQSPRYQPQGQSQRYQPQEHDPSELVMYPLMPKDS